jgi:hypothetical protein
MLKRKERNRNFVKQWCECTYENTPALPPLALGKISANVIWGNIKIGKRKKRKKKRKKRKLRGFLKSDKRVKTGA